MHLPRRFPTFSFVSKWCFLFAFFLPPWLSLSDVFLWSSSSLFFLLAFGSFFPFLFLSFLLSWHSRYIADALFHLSLWCYTTIHPKATNACARGKVRVCERVRESACARMRVILQPLIMHKPLLKKKNKRQPAATAAVCVCVCEFVWVCVSECVQSQLLSYNSVCMIVWERGLLEWLLRWKNQRPISSPNRLNVL